MSRVGGAALVWAALTSACAPHAPREPTARSDAPSPEPACAAGFRPTGSAKLDLDRLGRACGAGAGLRPAAEPFSGQQRSGEPSERFRLRLEAGTCYRILAIGERRVRDLDLALYGADPELVVADASSDSFPMIPPAGLLCVEATGDYVLEVGVMAGQGRWAAQVWRE